MYRPLGQDDGSESARFCGECRKNVYNISAMTRAEAESLLAGAEGKVCVRYYQRADGTVLTEDCSVGARTVRQRMVRLARSVAAAALALFAGSAASNVANAGGTPHMGGVGISQRTETKRQKPRPKKVDTVVVQRPDTLAPEMLIMGEIAPREFTPDTTVRSVSTTTPTVEPEIVHAADSAIMVPVQITIPVIVTSPLDPVRTTDPSVTPVETTNSSAHIQ